MVSYEPPLRKSLPDSELFRILSEIPADSEGMERAANLIAEQEQLRALDEAAMASWLSELEAEDSDQARAVLEKLQGSNAVEPAVSASPSQPVAAESREVATAEHPTAPKESFESLITGAMPRVIEPVTTKVTVGRARLADHLYLPLTVSALLAIANLGATSALVFGGGVILGMLTLVLAARGGMTTPAQLYNVAFGTVGGRVFFGITVFAVLAIVGDQARVATAWPSWFAVPSAYWLASGLFIVGVLALWSHRYLLRALAILPIAVVIFAVDAANFVSLRFELLTSADLLLLAAGILSGFLLNARSIDLEPRERWGYFGFAAVAIVGAAVLSAAMRPEIPAVFLLVVLGLIVYAAAHLAAVACVASGFSRLWVVAALAAAAALTVVSVELSVWSIAALIAIAAVSVADAVLRVQPIHEPSTRDNFGFYGKFSASAALILVLSGLLAFAALAFAEGMFGLPTIFDPAWIGADSLPLVVASLAFLLGLLRIKAVRSRELDQQSATGNTKLENLLGL